MVAYKGVRPKPDDERMRKNAPRFETVPVEWDGIVRGPDLPKRYSWCLATQQWWEEFRRSPQSMVCADSDWQFLLDTALLHDKMWSDPANLPITHLTSISAEFRRRMSSYGDTWDNRQKLRMQITSPQSEADRDAEIKAAAEQAIDYAQILAQEAAKHKDR